MKKALRNIALAGTLLLGSLGLSAQINSEIKASQREIKKELGI